MKTQMGYNEECCSISVADFAKEFNVNIIAGEVRSKIKITTSNINRPGLLLAGYEVYFEQTRVQVLGNAECFYMEQLKDSDYDNAVIRLLNKKIPCIIFARGFQPSEKFVSYANKYRVPVFVSNKITSELVNELSVELEEKLSYSASMHGTLLEVSGMGILITGNSGLGKSETALELIHRGHRLVADDNVVVKRINNSLIGTAPDKIRFFMEVRGIGIIDVRSMFGVGSVLNEKQVDLVIELVKWTDDIECERLGLEEITTSIIGVDVPKLTLPVMPGRNLAIVVEVAARNYRLKKLGYNAVEELLKNTMNNQL